ncbi:hypothetical protein P5_0036 [Aeromonas phage P5]|nr:hypothetical protein P5_0036 [Aeromonas phage P5]
MVLIRSTINPYISLNHDAKVLWFTGRLDERPIVYPFTIGDRTITSFEEGMKIYFPLLANAPTTAEVRAMGNALRARLKK